MQVHPADSSTTMRLRSDGSEAQGSDPPVDRDVSIRDDGVTSEGLDHLHSADAIVAASSRRAFHDRRLDDLGRATAEGGVAFDVTAAFDASATIPAGYRVWRP